MSPHSLTCEDISPLLDAYHDGELDKGERGNVASHLGSCPQCQAKLSEIESVVTTLKNLPRLQMARDLTTDPEYLKRVMAAIETSASDSTKAPEKIGAEIKEFPLRKRALVKSIFPLPGPVIVASAAAAAAVALAIVVPRYITTTNSSTIATVPKPQTNSRTEFNSQDQSTAQQTSAQPELKVAHNPVTGPELNQDNNSHQPVRSVAQANEPTVATAKELPADQAAPEIASAQVPTANEPEAATVSPSVESVSPPALQAASGDQMPEEQQNITAGATIASEPAELLALYPGGESNAVSDELAIPTDEDGLYALKL